MHPEVSPGGLVQRRHRLTKAAIVAFAPYTFTTDRAQPRKRSRRRRRARPDGSLAVLEQCVDEPSFELRIQGEPIASPACQARVRADPERAIARTEQTADVGIWERLTRRRLPRNGPDAVEPKQPQLRAEPQITVRRLTDGFDLASGKSLLSPPGSVRVLTDVERRIQGESATPKSQQHADRDE